MLYDFITKNEEQLEKKHYLKKDNNWHKYDKDKSWKNDSFLRKSEVGKVYEDMRKLEKGFVNTHKGFYIPSWSIHRFLDKEKDSMYFI